MSKYLFKIVDLFNLDNRGLVVVCDKTCGEVEQTLKVSIGMSLLLKPPRRAPLRSIVAGIEMLEPYSKERAFAFSLPKEVQQVDIPAGTEVWAGSK